MDIVYVFKESPTDNSDELRYSLRSLKNIGHGKVFIVGEKPKWAVNVAYLPVVQNDSKERNVRRNLTVASATEAISEDFILMNDDFFFMKQLSALPTLNWGTMRSVIHKYEDRYGEDTDYIADMKQVLQQLNLIGFKEPLSYELHVPMVYNKSRMRDILNSSIGHIPQFRSLYGNYFNIGGTYYDDVKVFIDATHNDPASKANPSAYLREQSFLSVTGGSFTRGPAGAFIRQQFPQKSPYEI